MSLQKDSKLVRFNNKFGYGKRWGFRAPRGNSERAILSIPFLGFIVQAGNLRMSFHQQPDMAVRVVMSSTLLGIPFLIILDLIGTIITQPIQSAREKKNKKEIQTISYVRPNSKPMKKKSRKIEKEDSSSSFTVATASEQHSSTPESLEDISIENSSMLESSDYE